MQYTKPKLIQLIHIAKQKLKMDEISYRALLQNVAGKTSSKAMTIPELMKVLHEMEQKGFHKQSKRRYSPQSVKSKAKSNIASKIRAIWIAMSKAGVIRDGSEKALNNWVRAIANPILQQQGKPLALNVGALDDRLASMVLERLKKWQKRVEDK